MEQASLVGLLRVILSIIVFIYLLRLVFRILVPFLMLFLKRQYSKQNSQSTSRKTTKKEGSITLEKRTQKKSNINHKDIGEYIDFEDIEDDKQK